MFFLVICLCGDVSVVAQSDASCELTATLPEAVGMSSIGLDDIDRAVEDSIRDGDLPGAVVLVARHGRIVYRKAFGNRAVQPDTEPMTVDTIFDIASLTKVVATTPAIMQLVDRGVVRLGEPVRRYLPKFTGGGKSDITVGQLMTHYSGLRPDFDLSREWSGYEAALEELWKEKIVATPGKEFAYSDLNFIALAEIVHAVSGQKLDVYAKEHIFAPLGMTETSFRPPAAWNARIAPTEPRRNILRYLRGIPTGTNLDRMVRGEVHDPTVWRMGGVAGQAGIFSSARDLAIYAQMLLNRGTCGGNRLLSEATVAAMTRAQSPERAAEVRGYGWDISSTYSSPRGDLFSGGFGHTGFTGTSLWIHPPTGSFIIILSNRVHPNGGKSINHLRAVIANIVASSMEKSDQR